MRRGETRFGIIGLLTATLLVLVALLLFARYPGIFRTGRQYRAVFRSVAGLNPGDQVRYGGIPVGSVSSMEIDPQDPTRLVVYFRVRKNTPMRADTRASITQVGLLGAPYLHLEPGSAGAPALPPGSTLATIENPSFQDAMRRLAQFLDRADTLLGGAERLANISPVERINTTLARMDTLMAIATEGSSATFAQLNSTLARVDSASAQLAALVNHSQRLVVGIDTIVRTAGPELATTQRAAVQTMNELHALLADVRDAMAQQGGVDKVVRNLAAASENIARLSDRLERDPASILKRRASPPKPAGPSVRE
ncbi:MAG TPA: MlaD family protein [Gemmatimonadaceae bacterium]|nr:MlaD family protein [Gemmatimonadaceae bacterium]